MLCFLPCVSLTSHVHKSSIQIRRTRAPNCPPPHTWEREKKKRKETVQMDGGSSRWALADCVHAACKCIKRRIPGPKPISAWRWGGGGQNPLRQVQICVSTDASDKRYVTETAPSVLKKLYLSHVHSNAELNLSSAVDPSSYAEQRAGTVQLRSSSVHRRDINRKKKKTARSSKRNPAQTQQEHANSTQ